MTRTVLINGVPGSGKSTVAQLLAHRTPMALALDIDVIKHALGQWESDPTGAGRQARRIALAAAEAHLATGHDVIMGQYLARTEFVEQLEQLSRRLGSRFFEFVLVVDQPTLRARLEHRAMHPHRPEHEVNARLVSVSDVPDLVSSTERLLAQRPSAWPVDASGAPAETVHLLRERLAVPA